MKKFSTCLLLVALSTFFSTTSNAQSYKTGVGLRGGWFSGLTVKHFIGPDKAIEGILCTRWSGFAIVGLMEYHKETDISDMNWYYGFGAHVGSFNRYDYYPVSSRNYYGGNVVTLGIDGILGLEYQFQEIPITLGLDLKPFLDIVNNGGGFFDLALSARYVF